MKITRDWQSEADRIQANNSIPLLNFSIKETVKERSLFVSSIPNNPLYRMFIANGTKFMKNIVSPLHRSPIILRVTWTTNTWQTSLPLWWRTKERLEENGHWFLLKTFSKKYISYSISYSSSKYFILYIVYLLISSFSQLTVSK